jgi:hypothetical protein
MVSGNSPSERSLLKEIMVRQKVIIVIFLGRIGLNGDSVV